MDSFRKNIVILTVLFAFFCLNCQRATADADVQGMTGLEIDRSINCIGDSPAEMFDGLFQRVDQSTNPKTLMPQILSAEEWLPLENISNKIRIPMGERYVLALGGGNGSISEITPPIDIDEYSMRAIDRAPQWLKADLIQCFAKFRGEAGLFYREILAETILEAEERYIDEIVFTIARISPDLWSRGTLYTEMVLENVQGVYAADEHLDYVRIVEHGSVEEGNFWSTLEYNVKTAVIDSVGGDTIQMEIDPYYYYWWVVHPRISDEVPIYIDPSSGRSSGPAHGGEFWRNYLMNHADEEYPLLRDMLDTTQVLWSNLRCNGSPENGAIGVVNQWVRRSMVFDSRQERPIQPVRIYALHMGRCGEHQDLTAAAARAALIPCAASMNICNDHVWNEFWAGRWIVWEPVGNNIDDSLRYEGRQIPGIFKYRGDGFTENVTSRYTVGIATLIVDITDENGNPVDGARISIYSDAYTSGYIFTNFHFTDCNGRAVITVGDQRDIHLRVDSEAGRYPANSGDIVRVIENSADGEVYQWEWQMPEALPRLSIEEADPVGDPISHFNLNIEYESQEEIVFGRIWSYSSFFANLYPAALDFFICDQDNYDLYIEGESFEAHGIMQVTESGQFDFTLPTDDNWYAVFSNDDKATTIEEIQIDASWSQDSEWGIPESESNNGLPKDYKVLQNYPNPFNSTTRIEFALPAAGYVELKIFDISGRKISSVVTNGLNAGYHSIKYNAKHLESGVYIYELNCNGHRDSKKMMLVR